MQDTSFTAASAIQSQMDCLDALARAQTIESKNEKMSLLTDIINFLVKCETLDPTLIANLDAYFKQIGIVKENEKFLTPEIKLLLRIKSDLQRKLAGTHVASAEEINNIINILASRGEELRIHIKYPNLTRETPQRADLEQTVLNENNIFKLRQATLPLLHIKNGELNIPNSETLDQQKCFIVAMVFPEYILNFPEVLTKLSHDQFNLFLIRLKTLLKDHKIDNQTFIHDIITRLIDKAAANKLTLNTILITFINEHLRPNEDANLIAKLRNLTQSIALDPKEVAAEKSRQGKKPPVNNAAAATITGYHLAKASDVSERYKQDIARMNLSVVNNDALVTVNSAQTLQAQLQQLGVKESTAKAISQTFDKSLISIGNNYLLNKLRDAGLNPDEQYISIIESAKLQKIADGSLQLVIKSKIGKEIVSETAAEITTVLKITSKGNSTVSYNLSSLNYSLFDKALEDKLIHAAYSKLMSRQQLTSDELALLNTKTDIAIKSIVKDNTLNLEKFNALSPVIRFLVAYKKPLIVKALIPNKSQFNGPYDILAGLVYHNKISLKECYALKPLGSTDWEKHVTRFALSPKNSKLQPQLHALLRAELGKEQAPITEQFNQIKNPSGFFQTGIVGSVVDFCVNVLSVAYETDRYKVNLQRDNARKMSQQLEAAHSVRQPQAVRKLNASADADAKSAIASLDHSQQEVDAFVAARNTARQSKKMQEKSTIDTTPSFQPSH